MTEPTAARWSRPWRRCLTAVLVLQLMAVVVAGCSTSIPDFPEQTTGADCAATQRGVAPPPFGADIGDCELSHADLTGAQLVSANLAYAHLFGADLNGAVLVHADLFAAYLTSADLTSANLKDANLIGADLTGAIWSNTTCPDGTNSDTHANTCVGFGIWAASPPH
jgi:hypothetical protein